jgi:hypothetical protein
VELETGDAARFRNGGTSAAPGAPPGRVAVFSVGRLLGVGRVEDAHLHPDKVLPVETLP